ncbi:hypothetical protein Tcan_01122, partial [Toxocara canis]
KVFCDEGTTTTPINRCKSDKGRSTLILCSINKSTVVLLSEDFQFFEIQKAEFGWGIHKKRQLNHSKSILHFNFYPLSTSRSSLTLRACKQNLKNFHQLHRLHT